MIKQFFHIFTETSSHFGEQEPGEVVILLLRRHKFTIMFPLSWIALFALVPFILYLGGYHPLLANGFSVLFWFLVTLYYMTLWMFLFYYITIYALNVVIVTDRRILQNEQYGFFNRKISELQAYRVQDISVNVRGIIETFFNYGDILVQTAGSEREFTFRQIANPSEVKDKIMQVVSGHQMKMGLN